MLCFWDVASQGNDGCRLVSRCKRSEDKDPIVTDLTADPSMKKVVEMVYEDRKERKIGSNQNLFLSVMWAEKGNYNFIELCLSLVLDHILFSLLFFLNHFHQKISATSRCTRKQCLLM